MTTLMSVMPFALQEESRDAKYLHPCLIDSSVLNEFGGSPRLSLDCMTSVAVPPLSTCMMASRTFTYSEIPISLAGNQYPEKEDEGEKDWEYRTYDKDTL